jgi:hypothetical protein
VEDQLGLGIGGRDALLSIYRVISRNMNNIM